MVRERYLIVQLIPIMVNRCVLAIFLLCGSLVEIFADSYVDSLESRLPQVDNHQKLPILDELIPYYFRNEPLKSSRLAAEMLVFALEENDLKFTLRAKRYQALSSSLLTSNHEAALEECRALELSATERAFMDELILIKLAIAKIYGHTGDYTNSLNYQKQAQHLSDSMNLLPLKVVALIDQANTYMQLSEFVQAERTIWNSLKAAKQHGSDILIAKTYMQFGDLYMQRFNHQLALEHYHSANELLDQDRHAIHKASTLYKIAESYFALGLPDSSFQLHLSSLEIRKQAKDGTGLAESFSKIGLICIENQEYRRAIDNLELALFHAERVNSNKLMQQCFDYLSQAYLGNGDFSKAKQYQDKYMGISELIYAEAGKKQLEELNARREIEQRELRIQNLQAQAERDKERLRQSRQFIITLIILLLVVIISVTLFIRSYRDKRAINLQLRSINEKVLNQNKRLKEVVSTKDKFFNIIGHDLKGPLNSLTSFSQLLMNHTSTLSEDEIRTIASELNKSLKYLFELLENLLGWAQSQTGKMTFDYKDFRITEIIDENVQLLSNAAKEKDIEISVNADEQIMVHADIESIKAVIRNLLSNAIKFTKAGGVITIFAEEWKDFVEIGIRDTGVGMNEEVQNKIFDIATRHTTPGTNQEKGTGLGLILCKEFVERNSGTITVSSKLGEGTTFRFTLMKAEKPKLKPVPNQ